MLLLLGLLLILLLLLLDIFGFGRDFRELGLRVELRLGLGLFFHSSCQLGCWEAREDGEGLGMHLTRC